MTENDHAGGSSLPARRLSNEQVEAVVRRAIELQADGPATGAGAGVTDEELVRIGAELGIGAAQMRQALAEVTAHAAVERAGGGLLGATRISATRAVPAAAEDVRRDVERYLVETQHLAVLRRMPERTIYEKSRGLQANVARVMDTTRGVASGRRPPRVGAGFNLRTVSSVEVSATQLDANVCWLTLTVDFGNVRTGYWAGLGISGGVLAGLAGLSAAVMIAPPAAVVALPIFAGSLWGARALYGAQVERARLHLEALLDHLEHGGSLSG